MKGIKKIILPLLVTASLILLLGAPRSPISLKTRVLSNGQAEINLKVNAKFDPLCLSKLEFSKSKKFDSAIYPFTIGHTTFSEGSIDFRLPGTPFDKQDKQIRELFSRFVVDCSATTGELAYSNTETLNLSKQSVRKNTAEDKFFTALTGRSLTYALKSQRTSSFETALSYTATTSKQAPQITLDLESASFKPDQDIVLRLGAVGAKPVRYDWYYTAVAGGESIKIKNSLGIEIINDSLGSTLLIRASLVDTRQFNNNFFKVNTYNRFGSALSSSVPVYISDDSLPTPVPSVIPTITPSIAPTVTPTINPTATNTVTPSVTPTRISTLTSTSTATATKTSTATNTRTATATRTKTATATNTNIPVCTAPACSNGTLTCGNPATGCPGGCGYICVLNPTPTRTATHTISPTSTATPTASKTATPTATSDSSLSYSSDRTWKTIPNAIPVVSTDVTGIRLAFNMSASALNVNSLTGLSLGAADSFSDLAAAVRFAPSTEGGDIDVRNGGSFASSDTIVYSAGRVYRVEMNVDLVAKRYSVSVDGTPIAVDYNFRTEQANVSSLNTLNIYSDSGSHTISNIAVELTRAGPLNGACGSASGGTFISPPTENLCAAGSATDITTSVHSFHWFCMGSNGGSAAPCSANIDLSPVNGVCGSADGGSFRSAPTLNLCSAGTPGSVSRAGDTYIWTCSGINSGSNDNCSATHDNTTTVRPVRIPSFGPNGTHWPELLDTPFMYDRTVPNIVEVSPSWSAIRTALQAVTAQQANQGTLILVSPGIIPDGGSTDLANVGSSQWTKRVTVAPRDGYGSLTVSAPALIERVQGVAFAGFIFNSAKFRGCHNTAVAWSRINGEQMGIVGIGGTTTENFELVEVYRGDFQVTPDPGGSGSYGNDNTDIFAGGGTNANINNWRIVGSYFEPRYWRYPYVGSKPHTDTLQFAKGTSDAGWYANMTIQDSALFTSNNCSIQTGNVDGLNIDNSFVVSGSYSKRRFPVLEGTNPDINDGFSAALNGSGKNFTAKDSIIAGNLTLNSTDSSKKWTNVSNSYLIQSNTPTSLNIPVNGSWKYLSAASANDLLIGPANPNQRYSLSNWQANIEPQLQNGYETFTLDGKTFGLKHPSEQYLRSIWRDPYVG